ncbi:MAG: hypothetical protein Q8L74_00420 [Nitrospirota bacterium]|nr:hypothetical protein [Nitrospirota bacterium]
MGQVHLIQIGRLAVLCVALICFSAPAVCVAEETRLSLAGLIEEFVQQSPEIKSARQRWKAAKAVAPQVHTLLDEHWWLSNSEHQKS